MKTESFEEFLKRNGKVKKLKMGEAGPPRERNLTPPRPVSTPKTIMRKNEIQEQTKDH